jgi:type III secretory pathway lipoprotein EscJ
MRNHWVNISVDGRKTDLATGPRRKDGEMTIELAQMNLGYSLDIIKIKCYPKEIDGVLHVVTDIFDKNTGALVYTKTTPRNAVK